MGYYIGGIILSFVFFVLKNTNGVCNFVFSMEGECGLDRREHEIMVFLAIIIFYKNRKAANWMHCLANMFLFCKLANIFLFLRADFIAGIIYICICLVHSVFYPEPACAESESTVIYNNAELYVSLPNLRFAKLDVGKWSQEANRFRINVHPTSKQLPTISLFKEGKEIQRRPAVHNRRALPFVFTKENCILAFDLINLYEECRLRMTKHDKEQLKNEQPKKKCGDPSIGKIFPFFFMSQRYFPKNRKQMRVRKRRERNVLFYELKRKAANERERKRMYSINEAFEKLRRLLPWLSRDRKISKASTLREAIRYIKQLSQLLNGEQLDPENTSAIAVKSGIKQSSLVVPNSDSRLSMKFVELSCSKMPDDYDSITRTEHGTLQGRCSKIWIPSTCEGMMNFENYECFHH
ncbi:hypothetical protein DINM_002614 [Dirofilaria immitis]|nr:hypothetical protein [Dirofilaria immitis]